MRKFKERLFKPAAAPQQAEDESSGPSSPNRVPTVSFPDGVEVLHDCSDATVDICFVHGLTGNRDTTSTAKGQSQPWPQALLAPQLKRARILTYGYDAYVVKTSVASSNRLIDHASNLLNDLTTDRASYSASDRPLIFVAHSLGGLVCKEAILLSRNNPEGHLKKIFECIKGIIFIERPSSRKPIFAVPFKPDPYFVSRESISSSIVKQLEQYRRAVLYGMGGTGKSQIAIAYAYQYHQEHPHSHVLWIYTATRSRFVQAYQQMARQLKLPGYEDPKTDACALVARWFGDEENGPWLLIVDNADDANLLLGVNPSGESDTDEDVLTKPLMDYLPRTLDSSRRLLITTRNKDIADDLGQSASPISVDPFSFPEARLLL